MMRKSISILVVALIMMMSISATAIQNYFSGAEYLCGYIDKKGNVLGEIKYDEVKAFGKDLAPVSINGQWGLINRLGEIVIPLKYLNAFSSDTGGGAVFTGTEWVCVDVDGKITSKSVDKPKFFKWDEKIVDQPTIEKGNELSGYEDASYCGYGIYFVQAKDGSDKYGFVNAKGEKLSEYDYEYPGERPIRFGNGLLAVRKNSLTGFVDTKLNLVIDYQFPYADDFCDGMAMVSKDKKVGFINTKGELIIDYVWDSGESMYTFDHFFNGFAAVMKLSKPATPPSKWAQAEINEAIKLNLIPSHLQSYYQSNIDRNDLTVTLGVVLTKVCGMNLDEYAKSYSPDYVRPTSHDINAYTYPLNRLGILKGRTDGSFGLNEMLTREELATILHRTMRVFKVNVAADSSEETFLDDYKISDWAKEPVYTLSKNGIFLGTPDGNFEPSGMVTREQAFLSIYRMYKSIKSK